MMTKRQYIGAGMVLLVGSALWLSAPEPTPQAKPTTPFMRQKLLYSQAVIEGLVKEDFGMIMVNGKKLGDMTVSNIWVELRHPAYMEHTQVYQKRIRTLVRAARQADLEESMEGFHQVMKSCVACHRDYRREQLPRGEERD